LGHYEIKCGNKQNKDTQLIVEIIDRSTSMPIGSAAFLLDSLGKVHKKGHMKDPQGKDLGDMFVDGKLV
jgi:hypothetical protein